MARTIKRAKQRDSGPDDAGPSRRPLSPPAEPSYWHDVTRDLIPGPSSVSSFGTGSAPDDNSEAGDEPESSDDEGERDDGRDRDDGEESEDSGIDFGEDLPPIPLEGDMLPWEKVQFHIPSWLPKPIARWFINRLVARGIGCTKFFYDADVVLVHHGLEADEKRFVEEMKERKKRIHVAGTDWFARVFFKGLAVPIPTAPPLFVDKNGANLLVAVADLGDPELCKQVMVQLECNGAIIVDLKTADTIIFPNGHEALENPPESHPTVDFSKLRRRDVDWVFGTVRRRRRPSPQRPPSSVSSPARIAENGQPAQPKQPARPEQPAQVAQPGQPTRPEQPAQSPTRRVSRPSAALGRGRNQFTADERDKLARWLAYMCPSTAGRLSHQMYGHLEVYDVDHSVFGWAAAHTPSAWREHYKRNRASQWKDGKVLDNLINEYVAKGVDKNLELPEERRARVKAKRQRPRSETRDSSESEPLAQSTEKRQKRRRLESRAENEAEPRTRSKANEPTRPRSASREAIGTAAVRATDVRRPKRTKTNPVNGRLSQKGDKARAQPSPAASGASPDELVVDGLLDM